MPKVKIERIIVFMRDRELAFFKKANVSRGQVPKLFEKFSQKGKLRFSLSCDAYDKL